MNVIFVNISEYKTKTDSSDFIVSFQTTSGICFNT